MPDNTDLNVSVASLAQRDLRPNRSLTAAQVQSIVAKAVVQASSSLTQFEPISVASGVHVGADWTTFDASSWIPAGASVAYLYCKATSRQSGDHIEIEFRRDSAGGTFPGAQIDQIEGSQDVDRDSLTRFLPITAARTFDYRVTGSFHDDSTQWEIDLEGYM